jgi:hypothetical protein
MHCEEGRRGRIEQKQGRPERRGERIGRGVTHLLAHFANVLEGAQVGQDCVELAPRSLCGGRPRNWQQSLGLKRRRAHDVEAGGTENDFVCVLALRCGQFRDVEEALWDL